MEKFYLFIKSITYPIKGSITLAISLLLFNSGQAATVTVGNITGTNYTSLTNAGGLFEDINSSKITGVIVATIISDINETGAVSLNQFAGSLTILSDGTMRTLSGGTSAAIPMININGADNVTIDGGIGKMLTFKNYSVNAVTITGSVFQVMGSSTHCVIKNCNIQSNSLSTSFIGAITIGEGVNSVSISYCDIRDVPGEKGLSHCGIYSNSVGNTITVAYNNIYNWESYGIKFEKVAIDCKISGNSFYMETGVSSNTSQIAIYLKNGQSLSITGNFIGGQLPKCGGSPWTNKGTDKKKLDITGIYLEYTKCIIDGNTIQNIRVPCLGEVYGINNYGGLVIVKRNKIFNIGASAKTYGIFNNQASGTNEFSNNMIAIGDGGNTIYGFYENSANGTTDFFYNSINISGSALGGSSSYSFLRNAATPYNFKNNILSNTRTGGTGINYAICSTPATVFTSDYNDFYVSGTGNVLGYWGGNSYTGLSDVFATAMGAHSISISPNFTSNFDLHLSSNPKLTIPATSVPTVSGDINEFTRNATTNMGMNQIPDISSSIWTGLVSNDWNTIGNWNSIVKRVPNGSDNVTIPNYTNPPILNPPANPPAICNSLTISPGAMLTITAGKALTINENLTNNNPSGTVGIIIQSDISGTGSLITKTATGNGLVVAQRWMKAGKWNIVSSPLSGQTIADFLTLNVNIPTATQPISTNRGMMDYDPATNNWNSYFTNQSNGNIEAGKGFSMRVKGSTAGVNDAAVTFTGLLQAGAQSANILTPAKWNCIGNPYTSAIGMNETSSSGLAYNFLTQNIKNLDQTNGAIYVWEEPDASNGLTGKYKTYSNATAAFDIQQGQAFMVKMNSSATAVNFNQAMQFHAPGIPLKSSTSPWPSIDVSVSVGTIKSTTTIAFNSAMTKGLDPTYDAGLLKGGTDLLVYSMLVEDNGIPFAIQALPDSDYNSLIIPIGLDFKTGGDVIFSSEVMNLPPDCKVILEDLLTKTCTDLSTHTYKITIAANSLITDRFRLKTTSTTTGLDKETTAGKLTAYANRNIDIRVKGRINKNAVATLYDVQGKVVLVKSMANGIENIILLPKMKIGIYMLSINDNGKLNGFKILVRE